MSFHYSKSNFENRDNLGKPKDEIATLYLIVYRDIMESIFSGEKTIEYRECTDYWKKRIVDKPYDLLKITNGYGNETRPYIVMEYKGYEVVNRNGKPHYAIPIDRNLWCEWRDEIEGEVKQC